MLIVIAGILVLLSLLFKKSNIIFILWALFFIILFGFNTYNPDYLAYSNIYRLFTLGTYDGQMGDVGYINLMKLAITNNLLYQQFLIGVSILTVVLLFYSITKFSNAKNLVCALIVLYPLTISIVQIRFFIAYALVFVALYFLENSPRGRLIFCILIILATTFHFSSILFLSLLLTQLKSFEKIYISVIGGILILFSFNYLSGIIHLPLVSNALRKYFFSSLEYKGLVFILRVIFFRLGPVVFLHILKNYFRNAFTDKDIFLMKATNIILIISMFFEMVNSEFERYSRLGYILFYIIVINVSSRMKLKSNSVIVITSLFVFALINFWFQNFYRVSGDVRFFDSVFRSIFENNIFLN